MGQLTRVGDIEVPQDLEYERHDHRVRRLASVAFALVILAGLLGLLGRSGPFSDASKADGNLLGVDYERFLRLDSPTELEIRIGSGAGTTEIAIAQDYLEGFLVKGFSAEPQSTTVEPDRVVYSFEQEAPSQLTILLEPEEMGYQSATVYGPDGARVAFDQWVWP